MTSRRPYLMRAMHEWISDNDMTPYIVVDATQDGVFVPEDYVEDGKIVLNVSTLATEELEIGKDLISFSARFGGVPIDIFVPYESVLGVYAKETGQGMLFAATDDPAPPEDDGPSPEGKPQKPTLKLVK
ncbi:MAG: ClpXP protease specificity-enhancing factor [Pseudomonadota bacterium]